MVWTWDQMQNLPRVSIHLDLHCVTTWSKFDTAWEGISLRLLVEEGWIKPKTTAGFVMQHAEHGYTTNLPLEIALQENFILAIHYDGQPLTAARGFPLRGVDRVYPRAGRPEGCLFVERCKVVARSGIYAR